MTIWDHPRMRGEHSFMKLFFDFGGGSSPHARGARLRLVCAELAVGIIPACAGSTISYSMLQTGRRDHPRMRGEHVLVLDREAMLDGSSPHARGALLWYHIAKALGGIIPACAGSTRWTCAEAFTRRDHPRMRGEHILESQRQ